MDNNKDVNTQKTCDAIVIGGGAAGMTAGIYLARAGKKVILIESAVLGGVMGTIDIIDNYPGVVNAAGVDLAIAMSTQIDNFGVEVVYGIPKSIDLNKKVVVVDGVSYLANKAIILAMGAGNKKLGVAHEDELLGKGLSYCATCDGAFYKNKDTVVVGNTLHTVTDALYLAGVPSKSVTMVVPTDKILAPIAEIEKLKEMQVNTIFNVAVQSIKEDDKHAVSGVQLQSKDGKAEELRADGVFVAVGYTPNTQAVYGQVALDDKGYIVVDDKMCTNISGVYAIGDIRSGSVKQVVASCSDGMIAAMSVVKIK